MALLRQLLVELRKQHAPDDDQLASASVTRCSPTTAVVSAATRTAILGTVPTTATQCAQEPTTVLPPENLQEQ
jgi:hypothetical protein